MSCSRPRNTRSKRPLCAFNLPRRTQSRACPSDGVRKILVEAVEGPVQVFNSSGYMIASVKPGIALSFAAQGGQEETFQLQGCLLRSTRVTG